MLTGRNTELKYLENCYKRDESQLLVVYGQKYIGKTAIMRAFGKGKPCHYYMARACSGKEHLLRLKELKQEVDRDLSEKKQLVIIDEFQNAVRNCDSFMEELLTIMDNADNKRKVLTILVSSQTGWVENRMVSVLGRAAQNISDVFKIRELGFKYVKEYFPWYTLRQCMEVYSILGGVPGLWHYFDKKRSLKENVCRNLLDGQGALHFAAEEILAEEIREPAVYNTLLTALALGKYKLNDLHQYTGFSRAKISVYLSHLIEMDVVEKLFSMELTGKNDTRKGLYRIRNHYLRFYYTYLYQAGDKLFHLTPERYYDRYVFPSLEEYTQSGFAEICRQHFMECAERKELPFEVVKCGSWFGKNGTIEIVAADEQGHIILGLCRGRRLGMLDEDYRTFMENIRRAKLTADYILLYADRFEEGIVREVQQKENIVLVDTRTL